jgi:aspartyl protease family protein
VKSPAQGPATSPAESPFRRVSPRALAIWLGLIGVGAVTFFALSALFPRQLSGVDRADALSLLGLLALVASGLVFARRMKLGEVARNIAIWTGVLAVALVGYTFRGDLVNAFNQVQSELIPAYAVSHAPHSLTVSASDDGGFYIMGSVNGAPVRFAIDTGANGVLLSPADAQAAGVDLSKLNFNAPSETANGVGFSAPYTAPSLKVGPITLTNLEVAVDKTPMSTSLLGMAFLRRLDSFEVHGDQLTLKWHG